MTLYDGSARFFAEGCTAVQAALRSRRPLPHLIRYTIHLLHSFHMSMSINRPYSRPRGKRGVTSPFYRSTWSPRVLPLKPHHSQSSKRKASHLKVRPLHRNTFLGHATFFPPRLLLFSGPHPAMFRTYSLGLGGPRGVPRIKPGSATFKENTLPTVPSPQPHFFPFMKHKRYFYLVYYLKNASVQKDFSRII